MGVKHGLSHTRINRIYNGMRCRCELPKRKDYAYYGGRGIKVCDEWQTPINFYKWAFANGYKDDLTLERIDVDKGYSPQNCKWVTPLEQNLNQRIQVNNKSGVVGVYERTIMGNYKIYIAKIKFRGRVYTKQSKDFDVCVKWRKDMEQMIFEKYGYKYDYKPNGMSIKIHNKNLND